MSYLLYHMSYIFYLLPRFYISLRDFLDLIELYWRFSVWAWRGGGGGGGGGGSVHVFMYMCHRAAGAVWIAESCGQVSDGGGRRSRTSSSSSRGGNGCGRTGEERTARDEEARWHGRLPPPPKKKFKKRGSAVCGGRGQEHKDAPVEAFNDRNTSSDSSSESEGENRFFEELCYNFRKKTSSSANKSSYKTQNQVGALEGIKSEAYRKYNEKTKHEKTAFHPQFTPQNWLDVELNSKVCFRN